MSVARQDAPPPAHEVRLSELLITPTEVISPVGRFRRASTRWSVGDPIPEKAASGVIITLAVILALPSCFMSLLLLLIKDFTGKLDVPLILTDGPMEHRTTVRVDNRGEYNEVLAVVNWARTDPHAT